VHPTLSAASWAVRVEPGNSLTLNENPLDKRNSCTRLALSLNSDAISRLLENKKSAKAADPKVAAPAAWFCYRLFTLGCLDGLHAPRTSRPPDQNSVRIQFPEVSNPRHTQLIANINADKIVFIYIYIFEDRPIMNLVEKKFIRAIDP
jgi:hypothetical protein